MMHKRLLGCALGTLLLTLGGCTPGSNGGGNSNSSPNDNSSTTTDLDLGSNGVFELSGGTAAEQHLAVSLTDQLGVNQLTALSFTLASADVAIATTGGATPSAGSQTTLDLRLAPERAIDPCGTGAAIGRFEIAFGSNGVSSVSPAELNVDSNGLSTTGNGVFQLCLVAASDADQTLTVAKLGVRFSSAVPALSCAEILALGDVQAAIDLAATNGYPFALQTGTQPRNIEGSYTVAETVTFDPDNADTGETRNRVDTFTNQNGDQITRTSGEASLLESISGSDTGVNLCVLARSYHTACDQTIARLETYAVTGDGSVLDGQFLAVVIERHTAATTCGAVGDFIYGSISLSSPSPSADVTRVGKVSLPDGFTPEFLVLPDDGGYGAVADENSDAAYRFPQDGSSVTTALPVPGGLNAAGYNGIALARDNSRMALISRNPDEVLVFGNSGGNLLAEAAGEGQSLGGDVFDFSTNAELVYVTHPDAGAGDSVRAYDTRIGVPVPLVDEFPTPEARTPDLTRLNPAGDQLAVLLHGDAGADEAQWLTFLDPATGAYTTPIDLRNATGGFVRARYAVYSLDGTRVFLAGRKGVVAVATTTPFKVTLIDVSGGKGDAVLGIDLSNDGAVVVAVLDQINGDANFAVVDAATLQVLNRQVLADIYARGSPGIVHFRTGRVCLVLNERLRVVAVQTLSPYAPLATLSAADDETVPILGRAAVGGNVIAVTNTTEPAIYVYRLGP